MVETREKGSGFGVQGSGGFELSVKVLDFGLAAEIRSSMNRVSQEKGDTSGTRPYMAPEQWAGKKQDGKTDQYALAVLFYELVSGEVPFAGAFETGDPIIMMVAVEQRIPEPLPLLSALQNAALMRALSKIPAQRYDSCSDLWEALSGRQLSVEQSVKALGENGENIVKAVQTFNEGVAWVSRLRIPHYLQIGRAFLVERLVKVPPVSRFIDRVLGVLIAPRQSWTSVQAEPGTIGQICKRYALALVALFMFPDVINAFHSSQYSTGYWTLSALLLSVVWQYLLTMAGLYFSARLISELAPQFGAEKARENAYKLVVFSLSPVFLSVFLYYLPIFHLPYWLVRGYATFLLYWGLKVLIGVEKKKLLVFTAVSFLILTALHRSLGYLSSQAERNLSNWAEESKRSWDNKQAVARYSQSQQVAHRPATPRPTTQRSSKTPPITRQPSPYNTQEDTYFEPSDIDSDSAIPPMNLPSDIWLHPKTLCTLIQRSFPSGSPTNTLVVFGLDSQAELNMFCEKMKENGWRITQIGYPSKQNPDLMASRGLSASFAKEQKTATLIQRKDCSFELVVCGPEDTPVNVEQPKQVSAPPVVNTGSAGEGKQKSGKKNAYNLKMRQQREAEKAEAEKVEAAKAAEEQQAVFQQQETASRLAEEKRKQDALDAERDRLNAEAKKAAEEQKRLDEEKAKLEEAKRIAQDLKDKEEQDARAKQEEELRIRMQPLYSLKKYPMDRAGLAKLKSLIQASRDTDEKCKWSIIYCLGMLAMGNTVEGFAARSAIARDYPRQVQADLSDRSLSDVCDKCEGGRSKQSCSKCKGSGKCPSCDGDGKGAKTGFNGELLRCLLCTGSGSCKDCNGTGSRSETCKTCSGRGYSFSLNKCKSAYLSLLEE
jgi:hypothetical protein